MINVWWPYSDDGESTSLQETRLLKSLYQVRDMYTKPNADLLKQEPRQEHLRGTVVANTYLLDENMNTPFMYVC